MSSKFKKSFTQSKEDRKNGQVDLLQRQRVMAIDTQIMSNEVAVTNLETEIEKAIKAKTFDLGRILGLEADLADLQKATKSLKEMKSAWFTDGSSK